MPSVEAEVYNNNKKCDWGGKKLKSLIRFHSDNKIDNYNRGRQKRKEKFKKSKRTPSKVPGCTPAFISKASAWLNWPRIARICLLGIRPGDGKKHFCYIKVFLKAQDQWKGAHSIISLLNQYIFTNCQSHALHYIKTFG